MMRTQKILTQMPPAAWRRRSAFRGDALWRRRSIWASRRRVYVRSAPPAVSGTFVVIAHSAPGLFTALECMKRGNRDRRRPVWPLEGTDPNGLGLCVSPERVLVNLLLGAPMRVSRRHNTGYYACKIEAVIRRSEKGPLYISRTWWGDFEWEKFILKKPFKILSENFEK